MGGFRVLKINKGAGQNFLVYFVVTTNQVQFWFWEEKMKPVKLDMFHWFLNLSVYIPCYFFVLQLLQTCRNTQRCERNYREKAQNSFPYSENSYSAPVMYQAPFQELGYIRELLQQGMAGSTIYNTKLYSMLKGDKCYGKNKSRAELAGGGVQIARSLRGSGSPSPGEGRC